MRGLIILCLVAIASADKLDTAYLPVEPSDEDLSLTPNTQEVQEAGDSYAAEPEATTFQQESQVESLDSQPAILTSEYQKSFYTFDAPADSLADNADIEKIINSMKKSLRVVFVKTPENKGFEEAALMLAKQASQDRTAVYVLAKQADIGDLAKQVQNLKSTSKSTPEIHFVKYRTPEDAAYAQRAIQEEYNTLPGASQNVNGGEAAVLNFASRAPVSAGQIAASPVHQYLPANPISAANDYLPPSLRRFRFRL